MTAQTQTAHIVALYFGLVPEKYREKTVNGLLKLLDKEDGHLVTGFVGTPYFCHALSQNGHEGRFSIMAVSGKNGSDYRMGTLGWYKT